MKCPVPVVRLVIPDEEGKVLILRRDNSSYGEAAWCLPGGKIDYGDTTENTVIKELKEETSLTCTSSRFLFYQDSLPMEEGKMHCLNLYFECTVAGEIILNKESSECTWIGPAELTKYQIVFKNDLALKRYWQEKNIL